uniref:ORF7 protein n=1 Tax=Bat Coronavirus RsGD17 TaxID=3018903 RepID=A0AA49ECX7_9NIDO|nr:ORF7 protein [Bat Coronavirus RsGD17]WCC63148.1 ORF7 protein [Bat Coronavirus RsGD17]WCC63155.1 ORF7 protein [Bat Coronavirus RsGD17]
MNQLIFFLCMMCCYAILFDWLFNLFFYACQVNTWQDFAFSCKWSWSLFFEDFSTWFKCLSVVFISFAAAASFMVVDLAIEVYDLFEHFYINLSSVCRFV